MRYRAALSCALTFGALAVCATGVNAKTKDAPADEYFGRLKMSILEITNRIKDAERSGGSYGGLITTQDALEDWTHKYPGDPWIPTREVRLWKLFSGLHSTDGDAEAARCRSFIHVHFPKMPLPALVAPAQTSTVP